MKRLIPILVSFALFTGFNSPLNAQVKTSDTSVVSKPGKSILPATKHAKMDGKIAPKVANSKPQVAPDVSKLIDQYKAFRTQQSQVNKNFAAMHRIARYDGTVVQPGPMTQEEIRLPAIINQIQAIKILLESQSDLGGSGDVQYWMRTESLLNQQGQSAVKVLNAMIQNDGANMNPLLRSALGIVAHNLDYAIHMHDKDTGDANFWSKAAAYDTDTFHNAAADLGQILSSLPVVQPNDPKPSLTATSWIIENFLNGNSDAGSGDANYWVKTMSLLQSQATYSANALDNLSHLPNIPPLAQTAIQNISSTLRSIAAMYSNGETGDSNFWMNACTMVLNGLTQAAQNLVNFRSSL
ncbi:MAG: hypothetical protein HQM08_22680 [Candidatus Riflebacteria bacterium]|nr:hypothetical protein [Candidatus Riflebacteria bacterium]